VDYETVLVRHILSRSIEDPAAGDRMSVEKDSDELTVILRFLYATRDSNVRRSCSAI
jgi:hypothetical protein